MCMYIILDGKVAPAGTTAIIFIDALSRNPKVYDEPEKFKPERFLESVHPFAFIPFSAGPRNCVGKHIKILFSNNAHPKTDFMKMS